MYCGKTLFSQVMSFLPWTTFARIVDRYDGDRSVRALRCTEHYRAMAFAQLTGRESLRDIEACLAARSAKLYHCPIRGGWKPRPLGAFRRSLQEELRLDSRRMNGSVPAGLSALAELTWLDLSDNDLNGSIPSDLGGLAKLEHLCLDENDLTGSIPSELGNLSNLLLLDLEDNDLSGSIPSELGNLASLGWLTLAGNRLSGCVPASLRQRLTYYDLGDMRFCDEGPGKPEPPTMMAVRTSILRVSWRAPVNTGAVISDYDVQYREEGSTGAYTDAGYNGTATEMRITGLTTDTSYEVQVRATSADGTGAWSEPGVGQTAALTVGFGAASYTASEGGSGVAVTIPITVSAGALTEEDDYEVSGEAVTFAVGESSKALTVTANEDADSADESVELGFGELPEGVSAGTIVTAEVVLSDIDPLTVTLSGPEGTVDAAFEVTVTFSEEVTGFEAADLTVVGGTVTVSGSGAQYTAVVTPSASGTVTVDVAAGVVQDAAGNGNEAEAQLSVTVQYSCTSGVAAMDPSSNPGLVGDCETLLAAKDELAGTALLNWSVEVEIGAWDGVTTAGATSRVTRLELRNRQLSGSIPTALGSLPKLKRLDLGNNRLSGTIPSDLGSLRNLTRLYLHSNELSGSIPSDLGDLSELKRLWLSANDLSGLVPSELGSLTNLIELYLQANRLSGCVPSALGSIATSERDLGELRLCSDGPPRPLAPTVTTGGSSSVSVAWIEPAVTGVTIDSYDVRYRESGDAEFTTAVTSETSTTTTITGLLPGRTYEVQVRANSDGQGGAWSPSGFARTDTLTVTFSHGPFTAGERGTVATVVVALSAAPSEATTIPIAATPIGTVETADYTLSGGVLTFAVSEHTRSITVTANEDQDSVDEAVVLEFGTLPQSVSEGTLTTARVTLTDNDAAPLAVSFGASAYTAVEGGTAVTIPVRLSQRALRELRVPITRTARGTTEVGDFAVAGLTAGMLTFAAGDDTKNISIVAVDDADAADEAVVIGFGAGVPAGSVATAEVTLDDDDTVPLTVAFGAASYTAVEGGSGIWVTVELSLTVQAHGTTAAGDFTVSGLNDDDTVRFAPGERVKRFTVTAVDDDADDADETVVLGLGAGLPAGVTARAVVMLQDDDGLGMSFSAARYRVAEGGAPLGVVAGTCHCGNNHGNRDARGFDGTDRRADGGPGRSPCSAARGRDLAGPWRRSTAPRPTRRRPPGAAGCWQSSRRTRSVPGSAAPSSGRRGFRHRPSAVWPLPGHRATSDRRKGTST